MEILKSITLFVSGGLVTASILLAEVGQRRSTLSRRTAALVTGVGGGVGSAVFILFGVSNGDIVGSVLTGIIAGTAMAFAVWATGKTRQ